MLRGRSIHQFEFSGQRSQNCRAPLFLATKWARAAVLRGISTSPGGANDRVHMKPICMSRSKHENFRSRKFIQGKYFLRFLYFALYHSVHTYEHYCRSSPQLRCEFLTGRAACGHFVVINKGGSLHVQSQYLVLKWKQRTAVKAADDSLQYIKMYSAGVSAKAAKGYLKSVEDKLFDFRGRFGAIYVV